VKKSKDTIVSKFDVDSMKREKYAFLRKFEPSSRKYEENKMKIRKQKRGVGQRPTSKT